MQAEFRPGSLRSTVPLFDRGNLLMANDLYQHTMGAGYNRNGVFDERACFQSFFRRIPFGGGYAVAAGLLHLIDLIEGLKKQSLSPEAKQYLLAQVGNDGQPLFTADDIETFASARWNLDIDAMLPGTVVFGNEPMQRTEGPVGLCQLIETGSLCTGNFMTLAATKAARMRYAAGPTAKILEFGFRRAHGIGAALDATVAAYIGGVDGTSNVMAGMYFGIPIKGTHAHSWVLFFEDERTAFEAYAEAMPANCVFLTDTYDPEQGLQNAIAVALQMRERGYKLIGIRLDSGDLAKLSKRARAALDQAGFTDAVVVASNDVDEYTIQRLLGQGARIDTWGIGTRLVTAYDDPALGGVFKLTAVYENGRWVPRIKISGSAEKTVNPGRHQIRRYYGQDGTFLLDQVYDLDLGPAEAGTIRTMIPGRTEHWQIPQGCGFEELLVPIYREGELVLERPDRPLSEWQARTREQLDRLPEEVKRFEMPDIYPAGLAPKLYELKQQMIDQRSAA